MEGQQLQGDDAQDALQAVHAVRHFDRVARVLDGLVILFVADDDGAALQIKTVETDLKKGVLSLTPLIFSRLLRENGPSAAHYRQP